MSDRLLIGYQVPFDTVNITLHTARSGGTVTWQYWNGSSFSSLALATDTTSGLTATGTVTFLPPSNWVPSVVNGSQSKYWVQITVSGAVNESVALQGVWRQPAVGVQLSGSALAAGIRQPASPGTSMSGLRSSIAEPHIPARRQSFASKLAPWAMEAPTTISLVIRSTCRTVRTLGPMWSRPGRAAVVAFSGMNGVMFDNAGCPPQHTPSFARSTTQTELGSTTYLSATTTMFQTLHTLLTATYGSNPRWWDGMNSCQIDSTFGICTPR